MSNMKKSLLTEELIHELSETKHIEKFLESHEEDINEIDLQTYLYKLLNRANYTIPMIIDKASISRSLAYQIFNGQRTPNRNLLLRIAITLKLNLPDTQRLLRIAKKESFIREFNGMRQSSSAFNILILL